METGHRAMAVIVLVPRKTARMAAGAPAAEKMPAQMTAAELVMVAEKGPARMIAVAPQVVVG